MHKSELNVALPAPREQPPSPPPPPPPGDLAQAGATVSALPRHHRRRLRPRIPSGPLDADGVGSGHERPELFDVPAAHEAFQSMVRLQNDVWLGGQIRAIHKWSANLLIAFILLHTIRVFIHKAYRPPRELNWMAGAFGFVAVLASGFTGYLLPWDQKAYWATVVGTSMAGTVPVIGGFAEKLLRGGSDVTGATLIRFYSLHVLWLPFSMFVILWAHFHMVKRQGIKGGL